MIHTLQGTITHKTEYALTIMTNAIGFAVTVPNPDLYEIGNTVTFHIYFHWNQEQGPSLFGFKTEIEKKLFELIISCSGIGPRIGIALLAAMSPSEFVGAIQKGDESALSSVNGIGTKKAEQIIVALKHKVAKLAFEPDFKRDNSGAARHQVSEVLKSLNYSKTEIHAAMNYLQEPGISEATTFDALMRKALAYLAKKT
ncbi:MAG: Holliday junction branch migration protein RuvA [Candidatus Dependentiae bacterium]